MSKKGRNPGLVDNWLDNLDLYRKNVAYDETCLFRAVSEQLFNCQVFHERVRKECIEYGRKYYEQFKSLLDREDWDKHLNMLEKHMVICGNLEINLISRKYDRDVLIFLANQQQIYDVTKRGLPRKPLMLCLMDDDHYDAVYSKEHIADAGFCQSLIYKTLYEEVFQIEEVDSIVNAMLYEKTHVINQLELEDKKLCSGGQELKIEDLGNAVIAPFPFKVAKALDSSIYRNIEYDSWGEVRRELRLGDWYYGDDKLKLGTRCVLNDKMNGEEYDCYIQELLKDKNKCVVYLTKFAEKRIVNYSDLAPESDAKPWPLPYRFSKNLIINNSTQLSPIEKIKNIRKKNKEKKQSKSLSEISTLGNNGLDKVSAFVGVPLQMHKNSGNGNHTVEVSTDTARTAPQSDGLVRPVTPDSNIYPQRYQWEQVHWPTPIHYVPPENTYYSHSPDSFVWPQGNVTPYYDYKPMVASAPATPNVVPYHDTSYPFYYNYHVDHYSQYPLTPTTPSAITPSLQPSPERTADGVPQVARCQYTSGEEAQGQNTVQTTLQNCQVQRQNVSYVSQTRQPLEIYSQTLPLPAGTPVIYTTLPPDLEMVVPTSPVGMYTPTTPSDMQYIQPPGYMYSSGQTIPWFPYNSQGFIFPQPNHQAK